MYAPASISAELRAIAASDRRPAAARLRDHFDDVQAAIASGVRRVDVLEILARNGLVMTFKTFVRTLARIRKERGLVRRSAAPRPETDPAVSQAEEAPNPAAARAPAPASNTAPDAATTPPAARERRSIAPVGAKLPDDWLTAQLTREQKRLLTPEQRSARAEAVVKSLWPNPFDPVPPQKDNPA
ncbi:hypothetical protein [Burkholderia sp. Ac-20353]|uniref:hypothetical protein n=1 Tax=Burkholderia sp. Ac-20353 TaxID=2703894 RepID=UPI00197B7B85|nr:hypothetical protein [Burkholderia sp. Ac-20353]MBN3785572.1 hypothetical protein [Burkholderia sp. Ac-20353]